MPPPELLFKLNVDATLMEAGGRVGFSGIVRDHLNDVLATICSNSKWFARRSWLKLWLFVMISLLPKTVVHSCYRSSAINVVNLVKNPIECLADIGVVIKDIHNLLSSIPSSSVHFDSRSSNKVAYRLAK
ncbi:hypothetical protein PanWU01x14_132790 [Parasponia andersonii]|uniref:RNase H type-1 domain-containing protein n=1 Tax=Parasponia andersonii TaxID=3476 RepID=A0A2P5CQ76_PARAD|nr:hypothetical protein PanWU01x14_132790 [Parasponia andersonii]